MPINPTVNRPDKSIAVLPFVNMSADPENEYFSDGITEEIINALTKINGLKVTARTSAFAFKNRNLDIRSIAEQLSVTLVLEGSVRKEKDAVRITAQLIRADDGFHLWSEKFDRNLEDIFAVQDEISLLIADQIRENFGHLHIGESLVYDQDIEVTTYQTFLKGKALLYRFNLNDIREGVRLLQEVVEQQPDFAQAHVNIHYAYNMLAASGMMPVKEALNIGKASLDRALQLDKYLPECHHSLGWHALNWNWDFNNAVKHLTKALELRPGYADAHQKMFITLILEGRIPQSFEHIQAAYQLDPLAVLNNYFMGYYYYIIQEFEQSNFFFERQIELEPSFMVGYSIYALSLYLQKDFEAILAVAEKIPAIEGADIEKQIMRTLAYCGLKDQTETEAGLKQLTEHLTDANHERVRFFMIYIENYNGNHKRSLELIHEGTERREPLMTLLKVDPSLTSLHHHEEWKKAIEEIYALSDHHELAGKESSSDLISLPEAKKLREKLLRHIEEEEAYLDPSLSLRSLAEDLNMHPNKLSWLLNEQLGKNFNEFVNGYRLDAFMAKAKDTSNKHMTLLGLAFDSGFNSKTAFNTFFKKATGQTPREWLKSLS